MTEQQLIRDELVTPVGRLTLIADTENVLFVGLPRSRQPDWLAQADDGASPVLRETKDQLTAWFDGRLREFDLPLKLSGTSFQRAVWDGLQQIGYGRTASYGELAQDIGRPRAVRAVGAANGANPVSIVVPCHRVIGSNGRLTGYGGGMAAKRWLLAHEQEHAGGRRVSA